VVFDTWISMSFAQRPMKEGSAVVGSIAIRLMSRVCSLPNAKMTHCGAVSVGGRW